MCIRDRAIELALNSEKLGSIKNKLAQNLPSSALFDCQTFTNNLELAYDKMHQKSLSGINPDHIVVRDLKN